MTPSNKTSHDRHGEGAGAFPQEQLTSCLRRIAASAVSARPDRFWTEQRLSILSRIPQRRSGVARPVLIWVTAALLAVIAIGIWVDTPRAVPPPDFAAGYDADLLSDVQRLVEAEVPLALEPAITREAAEK